MAILKMPALMPSIMVKRWWHSTALDNGQGQQQECHHEPYRELSEDAYPDDDKHHHPNMDE